MNRLRKPIGVISVPFDLGAARRGAAGGPHAIMQAGLEADLRRLGYDVHRYEPFPVDDGATIDLGTDKDAIATEGANTAQSKLNFVREVAAANRLLAEQVAATAARGQFPLVLGGDHSIAVGTIAGMADRYANLGVVWFDAHSDLNTAETTPSGNIHGMSLAASLGLGPPELTGIRGHAPKLKPENVVLIGTRSLDQGEKELIRASNITCYTMHDIDRKGIPLVMEETIRKLSGSCDGVHLSFDADSVDPLFAPGTGTPVRGGISYREAHLALELLCEAGIVTSAEFVEVNPAIDIRNETARLTVELIASLLGDTIL
ncbi:arginase [Cohnella faecalis]|uniref:Arginase n=1 Tax=Cohnella faecalis TaxID=2315694 RepID=A0A398CKF5_9BACL|nr:arginase [Cohnella faecalis]RIE01358.1 arginase [Cohnella faecalis]